MKKFLFATFLILGCTVSFAQNSQLPNTAECKARQEPFAIFVNVEEAPQDVDYTDVWSVWLVNESAGTVRKICQTNPYAKARWADMRGENANAVDVSINDIAAADKAMFAPGDVAKIIVEGCPDSRNIWTYIIDTTNLTAKQLPSTEGVVAIENGEIIAASYGYYSEGGRYTYNCAYDDNGQFLRVASEKMPE